MAIGVLEQINLYCPSIFLFSIITEGALCLRH